MQEKEKILDIGEHLTKDELKTMACEDMSELIDSKIASFLDEKGIKYTSVDDVFDKGVCGWEAANPADPSLLGGDIYFYPEKVNLR